MAEPQFTLGQSASDIKPIQRFSLGEPIDELPSYANGLTPETPIRFSPLSVVERLALKVGKPEASLTKLREWGYEDAKFEKNKVLLKKEGMWYEADPSGLGHKNPWGVTADIISKGVGPSAAAKIREFGLDLADLAPEALEVAANISKLGSIGGPASATGGAIAGASASLVKTSFGRLAGTYPADFKQQLKDAVSEAFISAGINKAFALGAPIVGPALKSVADGIETVSRKSSAVAKDLWQRLLSGLGGIPEDAAHEIVTNGSAVKNTLKPFLTSGGVDSYDVKTRILNTIKLDLNRLLDGPLDSPKTLRAALSDRYAAAKAAFLADPAVETAAKFNAPKLAEELLESFQNAGYVQISKGPTGAVLAELTPDKALERHLTTGEGPLKPDMAIKAIKDLLSTATLLANKKGPVTTGTEAAKQAMMLKTYVDNAYYAATKANESIKPILAPITSKFRTSLEDAITGTNGTLKAALSSINNIWSKNIDIVTTLERAAETGAGKDALLNTVLSSDLKQVFKHGDIFSLAKTLGRTEALEAIRAKKAALHAVNLVPSLKGLGTTSAITAVASATNPPSAILAGPLFVASSPRLSLIASSAKDKAYKLMADSFDAGRSALLALTPADKEKLLSNGELFEAWARPILQALTTEQEVKNLLQPKEQK